MISGVIKDTPAEAAGLMEGDVIYSVEGKEMNGLELEEVVSYIKGDEGTKVHITIYRNGEPIEMELYHDLPERRAHRDGAHKSQSDVPYC